MKNSRLFSIALALVCASAAYASDFYGATDSTMGEYHGFWTAANGARGRVTAQIRPLSNNHYDGFILIFRARSPVAGFILKPALAENGRVTFGATSSAREEGGDLLAESQATCNIANGKLTGKFKGDLGEGSFEAEKSPNNPPTLGAKPPAGATVLFDGQPGSGWEKFDWPVRDGVMQVGKGNIKTKEKLGSFRLHVEFRTPYMPAETGQARGNSGVYLQGKFEVQVLDSFGLYPLKDNDCGGIYHVQAPRMNACLPPMEWQTYDITYSENGPRVTVVQNGMTVIDHATIPASLLQNGTGGGDPTAGFLMLQDHGNAVQYRNIWALPLN